MAVKLWVTSFVRNFSKGAPMAIPELLNAEDYKVLQLADHILNGEVQRVLNENGVARFTVCPHCRADDFTHVEGCPLIQKPNEF